MKRPLTVFGFTMLFTLLVVSLFSDGLVLVTVSVLSFGLFLLSLLFRKIRQAATIPTILLGIAVACLLLFFSDLSYNQTLLLKGENLTVAGTVCEKPEFNPEKGRHYCIVKLSRISGKKANGKIRLSFSETRDGISHSDFEIGDKISFTATVYETGESNDSIKRYFRSQGVNLGAYSIKNLEVEKPHIRGIYYYATLFRLKAADVIIRHFNGDTAGLMIAVLTGDKSYVSEELYAFSKYSGVAHLMAVSGLHLSLWVFLVGALLEIKGKREKLPYIIMLFAVLFMMNFASLSGSVKRAGLMTILYLAGKILGKKADALNSLGFALSAVIMHNPYAVFDVGFMLSLFSTLGIIVMAIPLSNIFLKRRRTVYEGTLKLKIITAVTESILISISVALFTLPVTTYYFGYISSVSTLTNLIVLPFCMPLVALTGLFSAFSSLPLISTVLGLLCRYVSEFIITVVSFMGSLSFAKIHLDYSFLFPFLILCGIGLYLIAVIKNKGTKKLIVVLLSLIFAVQFSGEYLLRLKSYRINYFSDEGCYLVTVRDKGVLVGFSGDYYIYESVRDHTERTGVKIEAVLPDETAEYLNLNYAEYELGAEIIEGDCRITLYGVAEIQRKNGFVSIYGKKG